MSAAAATLLVVDDDLAIVRMLTQRLEADGYAVLGATSGAAALDSLAEAGVDVVISDINMPGMDGFELLSRIRALRSASELPVIMLSARDEAADVIRALHLGASDYATKPLRLPELERRIEAHLALKAAEGQVVRGYQLVRRLGGGAMGVVCEAVHLESGEHVALKVLRRSLGADQTVVRRFLREAELASRVEHPNVVRLRAAGIDGATHYIAMELVRGHDLAALLEHRPLELSAALGITRQIILALQAMAGVGVVHRDIKPENVLVADDGTIKVTDFGVAHDVTHALRLTDSGTGVGTVGYASPEQLRGRADFAADVYGLGCTLYFMLTGEDVFDETLPFARLWRQKTRSPRRTLARGLPLPPQVSRLIAAMLEPEPARRPGAAAVVQAVEAILGEPVSPAPRSRSPWRLGLAAAAVVALASAGVWLAL